MKKIIVATAVMGLLSSASVFAADGVVNFKGEIIDNACKVALESQDVSLGKISTNSLNGAGKISALTEFTIDLKECPADIQAAVRFEGTAATADKKSLALTDEDGVATGVGIRITDAKDQPIVLFTDSSEYDITEGDNKLAFTASYIATDAAVTAGPANGVAIFSITYR